jgi:uncharacterized membrane protein
MTAQRTAHLKLLLLPLVALIAVWPLIRNGCSCGHDFDFHLLSWMEAATQFRHGNLHPQWAFTPAFNAGEPRFVFYPPLSWTLGALLGMIAPWTAAPILYTWLALTAAGLGCYRLLREFAAPHTALLVAALYIVNPYMLFTAYERTAYAELLAAAWLPLLLLGVLRKNVTLPGIAVPIALLWLTNAPAAVIGCYSLAILAAVRLLLGLRDPDTTPPSQLARNTLAGTILGIGLAGLYIVPAAWERRYVQIQMAMTDGMRITDNFLFHRTPDPDHDAVLRTASLLAVSLLLLTAVTLVVAPLRARPSSSRRTLLALATLTLLIAILVTPISAALWSHAPELAFLQFPWRFLAILTPALALSLTLALPTKSLPIRSAFAATLLLAALFTLAAYHQFRQSCDPEDTVAARLGLFHSPTGTDPTDEYTPNTADNDALAKTNPPYWLSPDPSAAAPTNTPAGPLHWPFDLTSPVAQTLILNLRDYPAWRITLNHKLIPDRAPRNDGLLAIPLPAGPSHLDLTYARLPDRTLGTGLSACSLLVLIWISRRRRQPR